MVADAIVNSVTVVVLMQRVSLTIVSLIPIVPSGIVSHSITHVDVVGLDRIGTNWSTSLHKFTVGVHVLVRQGISRRNNHVAMVLLVLAAGSLGNAIQNDIDLQLDTLAKGRDNLAILEPVLDDLNLQGVRAEIIILREKLLQRGQKSTLIALEVGDVRVDQNVYQRLYDVVTVRIVDEFVEISVEDAGDDGELQVRELKQFGLIVVTVLHELFDHVR